MTTTQAPAASPNRANTPLGSPTSGAAAIECDGYARRSDYLELADGTRLAYDLLLPTRRGVPVDRPLPVLFKYTPYLRTLTVVKDGKLVGAELFAPEWYKKAFLWLRSRLRSNGSLLDPVFMTGWLKTMLAHGYAIVVVERPGCGASFGVTNPSFESVAREADQVLDWIAAQPWSDGSVGMFGSSWEAMTQLAAASTGNVHLKAITPSSPGFDLYALIYPGGIYNRAFSAFAVASTSALEQMITPVDGENGPDLLARALAQRAQATLGATLGRGLPAVPWRDSRTATGESVWEAAMSPAALIDRIERAQIPMCCLVGWYDLFTRDAFQWYVNLTGPCRLVVRPTDHGQTEASGPDLDLAPEMLRWFDRWLRGADNGITDDPSVRYYLVGAPRDGAWRSSGQWPGPNQRRQRLYFQAGRSGSVSSVNDGCLGEEPPTVARAGDPYTVDYSASSGLRSRWVAVESPARYPNMRANDERGLTYTTAPLEKDLDVVGHPVVHLWIETQSADVDFHVYLEDVAANGRSTYVTEGQLRASHRGTSAAPFANIDLPYHRSYAGDASPIPPGEPVELVFDMQPTARRFGAGRRLRISVTCADAANFATPISDPAPEIRLLRAGTHASFIELPVDGSSGAYERPGGRSRLPSGFHDGNPE